VLYYIIIVDVRCGCCGGRNNVPAIHIVPTNYYYHIRRSTFVGEGGNGCRRDKACLHPTLVVGIHVVPIRLYNACMCCTSIEKYILIVCRWWDRVWFSRGKRPLRIKVESHGFKWARPRLDGRSVGRRSRRCCRSPSSALQRVEWKEKG